MKCKCAMPGENTIRSLLLSFFLAYIILDNWLGKLTHSNLSVLTKSNFTGLDWFSCLFHYSQKLSFINDHAKSNSRAYDSVSRF